MKCLAVPTFRRNNLYFSITYLTLFLLTTSTAFAGGSIFGGHKSRTSNPNGVSSIGVHICGSLNCPDVILKKGDCGLVPNTTMQYGVCTCQTGYHVVGDECVPDLDCGEHGRLTADGCICEDGWYGKICDSDCDGFKDEEDVCHSCSETDFYPSSEAECDRCPERSFVEGQCFSPCEEEHFNGYFNGLKDFVKCAKCSMFSPLRTTQKECDKCSARWLASDGYCWRCAYDMSFQTTEGECSKCDNTDAPRKIFEYEGRIYCGLINCPTDYLNYRAFDGSCVFCSDGPARTTTLEECSKCTNRTYNPETGECSLAS